MSVTVKTQVVRQVCPLIPVGGGGGGGFFLILI